MAGAFDSTTTETVSSSGGGIDASEITGVILSKFFDMVQAVLIVLVAYFAMKWVKRYFSKIETTHQEQRTALNFVDRVLSGFILVIGVTLALKVVGLDISLLVSVGVLGLSYGLKDVIKNYVAGILIFFKAPFKIGDVVKIKKYVGKVERMDFQSTGLRTFDQRDITIYNSDIMSQSIENYSRSEIRRVELEVKVGYGTDLGTAIQVLEAILKNEPMVREKPKHSIVFKKFTEGGLMLELKFWVPRTANILAIRTSIGFKMNQMFDEETIYSPYTKAIQADGELSHVVGAGKSKLKTYLAELEAAAGKVAKAVLPEGVAAGSPEAVALEAIPEIADADEPYEMEEIGN